MTKLDIQVYTHDTDPEITVIALDGELDTYTHTQFHDVLSKTLEGGAKKLVLHLQRLRFMSSTGIGVIIGAIDDLEQVGGRLQVCNANDQIWNVFEIVGLSSLVTNLKGLEDAPRHFS